MNSRKFGSFDVTPVSLGCMNLSHAYGTPPSEAESIKLLNQALDLGYTMLDTAALYGFGANESLVGKAVMHRRSEFTLASKCGIFEDENKKRTIDGRPETIRKTCEDSLSRLGTDVIDLYYLHRWDMNVPIEDSVGELSRLVEEGKVKSIGLSEVSSTTLRKAHAVHPIAALQTEYSLWTRNPEISVLDTCEELGTTFVAFSPLARGYLGGVLTDVSTLEEKDLRRTMPRFDAENYARNLALLPGLKKVADEYSATSAQIALAWLLGVSENIIVIPGTTNLLHLEDNLAAGDIKLSDASMKELDELINQQTVSGTRYNDVIQKEIDTEEF